MGVSALVIGKWLGFQISKPDDKHVNANGDCNFDFASQLTSLARCG
jgi:hypothetical protein